jgi:hypothetical protein
MLEDCERPDHPRHVLELRQYRLGLRGIAVPVVLPTLPSQILLITLLYDVGELTIPWLTPKSTDDVAVLLASVTLLRPSGCREARGDLCGRLPPADQRKP